MGDVPVTGTNAGWQRLVALAILTVAAIAGCTSSKGAGPAKVVEARPVEEAPAAEAKAVAAPAEIRAMDLREGAPEVFVDLQASAPLVWTSFRNAEGKVVVELPNALPTPRIQDLNPDDGLVASVKVQRESEGSRPMTRLIITTRHEVEHSVTADGSNLQIRLLPIEETAKAAAAPAPGAAQPTPGAATPRASAPAATGKPKMAFEPVAPSSPAPRPAATAAGEEPASGAGTPDRPAVAAAPTGSPATRIEGIEVVASDGSSVIRISGDGEFPYSTFVLEEPPRFVIDFQGVVNRSPRSTLAVQGGVVQRVRVAQFKPSPKAVARVVFDLKQDSLPRIERMAQGLVVTFPAAGAALPAGTPASMASVTANPATTAEPGVSATRRTTTTREAPATTTPKSAQVAPAAATKRSGIEVEDAPPAPSPASSRVAQVKRSGDLPMVAQTGKGLPPSTDLGMRQQGAAGAKGPKGGATLGSDTKLGTGIFTPTDSFQSQSMGQTEETYHGEPIDLKVTNADVTEVLRTFAQISGLNVVVQPGVTGTVTAELENVPWDQALAEVLKINNLGFELNGNVMRIAPTSVLRQEATERQQLAQARALAIPLRTIMRRLSYSNAQQVANLLKNGQAGLLSQRGSVIVDDRTNTLIIKELPSYLDAVLAVVESLDIPEPQVMIEARIIETTKNFSRNLGINWGFNGVSDAAHGNTTGLIFPNNGTINGNVNIPSNATNGSIALHLGNVANTFQLDVALQAAENEGLINILSAPKVATLNNQQASIQSGTQIPVQTVTNGTITVQYINATLRLDVTPQVTAEGTVMMDINISKKEPQFAFLVPGATNAPIATKDAKTRLVVRDGGTAVIGGIYKVTSNNNEVRVPGLANIPIIGHLFKTRNREEDNDELLIFITPRVVKI